MSQNKKTEPHNRSVPGVHSHSSKQATNHNSLNDLSYQSKEGFYNTKGQENLIINNEPMKRYNVLMKFFYRYLSKYKVTGYILSSSIALLLLGYFLPSNVNPVTAVTKLAMIGVYYWSINYIIKDLPVSWNWLQARFRSEMNFLKAYTFSLIILSLLLYSAMGVLVALTLNLTMIYYQAFTSPFTFLASYFSFMVILKLIVVEVNLGYIHLATNSYSYLKKTLSRILLSIIVIGSVFITSQIKTLLALSVLISIFSFEVMIYEFRK